MSSPKIRVLIIDDTDPVRESLCEYLEDCGFAVRGATDADQGMQLLAQEPADAVVVDLRLPGISGEAFIRQAIARWPQLRFLIFTGSIEFQLSEDLATFSQISPEILIKPLLDLNILTEKITRLVARS